MDRQADRIQSEIDQRRADIDRKLSRLESRARAMTPGHYARTLVRRRGFEQVTGTALLLAGAAMAWRRRPRRAHRD